MKPTISRNHLPVYFLIISLFLGNFLIQYAALALFLLYYGFSSKPVIKLNRFFFIPLVFILIAFTSYFFNYATGKADGYSIFFWLFSYLPPFLLLWVILPYSGKVEFGKVYSFYKKLVYIQSFLLIFSAFKHGKFIVGDPATGTVGDANWVAFHICVVLLYEISRGISILKGFEQNNAKNYRIAAEIVYFFIVLLIPESTANVGFLLMVLAIVFFKEYLLSRINFINVALVIVFASVGFYLFSKTYVYERIEGAVYDLRKTDIDKNPYLSKVSIYKKLVDGEIFSNTNWLIGSGPSTFTSRSSVMRMPEERVNDFPINLPYYKSYLFNKYISPIYASWRKSGESYGNFASPQTTIISVSVELGLLGIFCFSALLYLIIKKIRNLPLKTSDVHLRKFGVYFSIFFIINLFHLNFWEYPIITFTYLIFISMLLSSNKSIQTE